jgi:hypothetical protein
MLCPVGQHESFHPLEELLFIFRKLHVNEVNDDDAADIPQPQLPGNFIGCFQVGFQGILFLVVAYAFIAAVYVNYMEGFGVFNNQVGATVEVNCFAKGGFYLFGNPELVENGCPILVKAYDICLFRRNPLDIIFGIGKNGLVIGDNAVEVFIEQVTEYAGRLGLFAQDLGWRYRTPEVSLYALPHGRQFGKVFMQFSRILPFSCRADNDAEILGLDRFNNPLQSFSFLCLMDFARTRYDVVERSQDYKTAG